MCFCIYIMSLTEQTYCQNHAMWIGRWILYFVWFVQTLDSRIQSLMGYPIFQGLSLKPRQNSSLNFNRAEQTFLVFSLITHEEINILLFDVLMILGKLKKNSWCYSYFSLIWIMNSTRSFLLCLGKAKNSQWYITRSFCFPRIT